MTKMKKFKCTVVSNTGTDNEQIGNSLLTANEIVSIVDGKRGGAYISIYKTAGYENITPANLKYKNAAKSWAKKAKKNDIRDTDKDGVPNATDCDPNDPNKQDFGFARPKPQLLGGYPIDNYYFVDNKYELQPNAKQDKSWLRRQKRRK